MVVANFVFKAVVMPLKLLCLLFTLEVVGSRLGQEHGSCGIVSTNLSRKSVKDALDLEGFHKAFNYKMRYLRELFLIVFMMYNK